MVPCMVPAEWASTFDRLIGIDRTTERLSATAGWRKWRWRWRWRYCGAAAMAADSADDGHSGRPASACLLRAASADACLQPLIKVGIPRSRSS